MHKAVTGLDRESAHLSQLNTKKGSCCTAANPGVGDKTNLWHLGLQLYSSFFLVLSCDRLADSLSNPVKAFGIFNFIHPTVKHFYFGRKMGWGGDGSLFWEWIMCRDLLFSGFGPVNFVDSTKQIVFGRHSIQWSWKCPRKDATPSYSTSLGKYMDLFFSRGANLFPVVDSNG